MVTVRQDNSTFNYDDVADMISAVNELIGITGKIINKYHCEPVLDSIADQEKKGFPNKELVEGVHSRGYLSMEFAADHLMVFADSMKEPAKSIAPWTCVRGLVESCALAVWFLDPTIDVRTRVGRCFAFRYKGFQEQKKFINVYKNQADLDKVNQKIIEVKQEADLIGYPIIMNKVGEINGIALNMPSIIELIRKTLNLEGEYRLLSAIAHGHHWAAIQTGFHVIQTENLEGQSIKALEKHLSPEIILKTANIAVKSFSQVLWDLWRLYGWDLDEIERIISRTYKRLHY